MEGQKEGHPSWWRKQEEVEGRVGLQDLEVKAGAQILYRFEKAGWKVDIRQTRAEQGDGGPG